MIVYVFVWPCTCVKLSMRGLQETLISGPGEATATSVSGVTANQLSAVHHLPADTHIHTRARSYTHGLKRLRIEHPESIAGSSSTSSSLAPLCCHHRWWFVSGHLMIGIFPFFYTFSPPPQSSAQPLLSHGEMSHLHRFAPLHFC